MLVSRLLIAFGTLLNSGETSGGLDVEPARLRIVGPDRRARIVATGTDHEGRPVDLTHAPSLRYKSLDPRVARVDGGGRVEPVGDGTTSIAVEFQGQAATVQVLVEDFAGRRPVSFVGEVVPIFSRLGCNAGSCHGKASGQNGFRLSLLGFDPRLDYESLAREGRGRRAAC